MGKTNNKKGDNKMIVTRKWEGQVTNRQDKKHFVLFPKRVLKLTKLLIMLSV